MKNQYDTRGGLKVTRETQELIYQEAIEPLIDALDSQRGALYASSFEFPGRYTCWDIGFVNPPLMVEVKGFDVEISGLNQRASVLLEFLHVNFQSKLYIKSYAADESQIRLTIQPSQDNFPEELRSKQNSVFSVIRDIVSLFYSQDEAHWGLYGAFGYDLIFQFENLTHYQSRDPKQRDMVLFLPDEIYVVDHRREVAEVIRYDYCYQANESRGLSRVGQREEFMPKADTYASCDHRQGEYAALVDKAKEKFKKGDLFEVVPSQTFTEPCEIPPSEIFRRMRERNPSPYGFLINLGEQEYLVGASPEMYVRVSDRRVETCPISGTVVRGQDALDEAHNILSLLNSEKDYSELTMCTDVDRNDKSRICEPGSVKVIGRRQIEIYSRLIHTVDHVEGILRDEFDAIDAFLSHMWVVTITGAPKLWAMQFIEQNERSARRWYGGAVGWLGFNGNMNTGLILRTVHLKDGVAKIRVGATLLFDSVPEEEEQETRLKASAFIDVLRNARPDKARNHYNMSRRGEGKTILLIDHEDSFVHTLANYLRQTGAKVVTLRKTFSLADIKKYQPHLIFLSPGPGQPKDFNVSASIDLALEHRIPLFGVCLGLQAIVEYFGGNLETLAIPMHGKSSFIKVEPCQLFSGLEGGFIAGRYHSLVANRSSLPKELKVTACTEDGLVMAIEHEKYPLQAVQFHPETILSLNQDIGLRIIDNLVQSLEMNKAPV